MMSSEVYSNQQVSLGWFSDSSSLAQIDSWTLTHTFKAHCKLRINTFAMVPHEKQFVNQWACTVPSRKKGKENVALCNSVHFRCSLKYKPFQKEPAFFRYSSNNEALSFLITGSVCAEASWKSCRSTEKFITLCEEYVIKIFSETLACWNRGWGAIKFSAELIAAGH